MLYRATQPVIAVKRIFPLHRTENGAYTWVNTGSRQVRRTGGAVVLLG